MATYHIDLKLDGVNWTDVTADARASVDIAVQYGISGTGPADRVAQTGTLSFALDNSEHNSGGLIGYYAPGHANCRNGFEVGCPVRLRIVDLGVTYYKFVGTLETIEPESGQYLSLLTTCQAVDWLDEAAKQKVRLLPTQIGQRGNQLIDTIVAAMTKQPAGIDLDTGDSVFPYALDTSRDERFSPMTEFQRVAMSELGFIFIAGDTSAGGKLTFQARRARQVEITPSAALSDSMSGLKVTRARSRISNRIKVVTHPRRVDLDRNTILFSYTSAPSIGAGQTQIILGQYRDPNQLALRCGGIDMVTPVAGTDYLMNSAPDGSGTDLTANFSVTASFGGNGVEFEITNNGSVDGYVTLLQARGRGVYDDNEIAVEATDSASKTAYGENVLTFDMPMQMSQAVGQDIADYLLAAWKAPQTAIDSVEFIGNRSAALMLAGLASEPGTCVTIEETATGVAGDYHINGVTLSIRAPGLFRFGWSVMPVPPFVGGLWQIGIVGHSEIGQTTTLGF